MRRWRGSIDVPLTYEGYAEATNIYLPLSVVYHDSLSRCRDTAECLAPDMMIESRGPRPWRMGTQFEGKEITEESIRHAQCLVSNPWDCPYDGEPFGRWYEMWLAWISRVQHGGKAIGVVTHNRNIQALYATHEGGLVPRLYNVDGPGFLTVHVYDRGHIAPWGGRWVPPGIYLIRHGETSFGT